MQLNIPHHHDNKSRKQQATAGTTLSGTLPERQWLMRKLHGLIRSYGLEHKDLSELAGCSLKIVHIAKLRYLEKALPLWEQLLHCYGHWDLILFLQKQMKMCHDLPSLQKLREKWRPFVLGTLNPLGLQKLKRARLQREEELKAQGQT